MPPQSPPGAARAKRSAAARRAEKYVYSFAQDRAEGDATAKDLLGGKGASLAEMCRMGLPVPPGFTITTEVCTWFYAHARSYPAGLEAQVKAAMARLEKDAGKRFGDPSNPLLVSVRSGARVSMPGMMDTVLNLGLSERTVLGLAARSGNARFAWDAYRRFVQMYGDVVLGIKARASDEPDPFDAALEQKKRRRGARLDSELSAEDLRALAAEFKDLVRARTGRAFPDDPWEQLWGAVGAVFGSWENPRAVAYRQLNEIPGDWGTAVSVCAMVFGNMGPGSGTGVAFTRDPSTGERVFYGEYLEDAQGEDVVAGIRTPEPIARLAERMPKAWKELSRVQARLEKHFRDMQDLEFTVEDGRLYLLQCRAGKRTAFAAVRIAVDMVAERLIDREEALARIPPASLEQLLRPVFDPRELERARRAGALFARGLNAGPGAAAGVAVFGAEEAERRAALGETVILVRLETSPEDIRGMQAAAGILTARGGMTSHAALVARQMGKVCVAGAGALEIDARARRLAVGAKQLRDGEWLSLDGSTGEVYAGRIATRPSPVLEALAGTDAGARRTPLFRAYERVMRWADEVRTLSVRANADQGDQCAQAVAFGAEGVGLCRTEHMFFGAGKIGPVREFILAANAEERQRALAKLLPLQRADFEAIFTAMGERPVTIRTLDPPLHEFLPSEPAAVAEVAASLGISPSAVRAKVEALHELNPMLGHRGCRLGISYPELTRMQARALFEAACAVAKRTRRKPRPEIMIPLVATRRELELQAAVVRETADAVLREAGVRLVYSIGTMIELPRACMAADSIAEVAEFFSFGTNDLTQTTFGISRDDGAKFLPRYLEQEILAEDPFASLDREGVGALMKLACQRGRMVRERIKLGICGEHGGDPKSIALCQELGLDYVSCSPFRIPIARLAAAQAALAAR